MTHRKPKANPVDVVDALYDLAGEVSAEDGHHTPEQMRWARGMAAQVKERIAEKRRASLPASVPRKRGKAISAWLFGLDREALLAKLAEFAARGPTIQMAHRNLRDLSDDDLRRIVDLIEPDGPTAPAAPPTKSEPTE